MNKANIKKNISIEIQPVNLLLNNVACSRGIRSDMMRNKRYRIGSTLRVFNMQIKHPTCFHFAYHVDFAY